jgi:hypothetical protein
MPWRPDAAVPQAQVHRADAGVLGTGRCLQRLSPEAPMHHQRQGTASKAQL